MIIATPYFSSSIDGKGNYQPYDIFCLQINLSYHIEKIYGDGAIVVSIDFPMNGRDYVGLKIIKNSEVIDPNERVINTVNSLVNYYTTIAKGFVIILSRDRPLLTIENKIIPSDWMSSVMDLIEIPDVIDRYDNDYGMFVNVSFYEEYQDMYDKLSSNILYQVRKMYERGIIVCDEDFAKKWKLENIEQYFYSPTWKDDRFARNMTCFLYNVYRNDNIFIDIGLSDFDRHNISSRLNELKVHHLYNMIGVYIVTDGIEQTQMVVSIIFNEKYKREGTISVKKTDSDKIFEKCVKVYKKYSNDVVIYKTLGLEPYCCSSSQVDNGKMIMLEEEIKKIK